MAHSGRFKPIQILLFLAVAFLAAACNLANAPEQQLALTEVATFTPDATRTSLATGSVPTTLPISTFTLPTTQPLQLPPTSISLPPTFIPFPTSTPTPISIVILSPIPGNVVAGNVQVLGAAIHPQFLQYQLEYGPDPNPANLWYPATGIMQAPVLNGFLGIWNTTAVQDSNYQLRLRVTLRDGTSLATVVNNIRIQNQAPTPIPSATPNIPRPIAAFTQDRTAGQAPLVVKFLNQSSGNITSYSWSFGDGGNSGEANPTYTFRTPGIYNVTLTVNGPGGSSNVSRQINVQSASAPVAGFTQDKTTGSSPLSVRFSNQSTGQVTSYSWTFGDGTTSNEQNPTHQFTTVGTYNVIFSVTGPGGTSFVTRKITVEDPVVAPPKALFAPDKLNGNAPLTVQFSNQSTGQITSYNWDFGDGQTSSEINPSHVYSNAGNHTVILTAIGPGGQNAYQVSVVASQPPQAPVAKFITDKTSGDIPLAVKFTNQSTGQVTSYSWDFGDGGTSTDQNPTHSYAASGTYTIRLVVNGPGGSDDETATITATQPIAAPVAGFSANPASGNAPLVVQFSNQSQGESLTYSWTFGDNSGTSTDANPSYTYNVAGTYTVTLTASNSAGSNSTTQVVTVSQAVAQPVASFTANPASGEAPLAVTFSNASSGDNLSYTWDFGDSAGTSTDANPSYTYNVAGTYTVTLTASNSAGSNSTTQVVTVSQAVAQPVASFTANPASGEAPLAVTFSNASSGDNLSYTWDFGDSAGTSTDANPSYTYNVAGTYTVTLTASNSAGSNSTTQVVTVSQAVAQPVASFTANPASGEAPLAVTFSNASSGDNLSYTWDFGDSAGTSTDANPSYTYNVAGTYTVTLTASNSAGSNSTTQVVTVSQAVAQPVASFTANPASGEAPLAVTFSNASSGDNLSYTWDFGDSAGTSTDANPSYTYNVAGTYTVTLTASNSAGSNSTTQVVTVSQAVAQPVASFTANPASGEAPLAVTFSNASSGDNLSYTWDFGDSAGTSTDANPSYTYNVAGTYTVTLTASNSAGSNSTTQVVTVSQAVAQPVASFTANPASGEAPLAVTFSNASSGDNLSYTWDFGDSAGTSTDANPSYTYNVAGTYTVTLTASNSAGSNSTTQVVTVNDVATPKVTLNGTIAYVTNRDGNNEIYILSPNNPPVNVTNNPANDFDPAWSPDGNRVAFVSDRDGNFEIYVMGADGSNVTRLTDNPTDDTQPVWSSDGSQIVFVTNRDGNNEIYAMNSDGSNLINATNNPADDNSPAPSPDGTRLAFVSNRDGNYEIYTAGQDGVATNVTNQPANDGDPSWSSNNAQIVFSTDRDGFSQVYVMNGDGSNATRISDNLGKDTNPSFSPDNSQVIFVSDRDGFAQLYVMNSDGSGVSLVSDGAGRDSSPAWKP